MTGRRPVAGPRYIPGPVETFARRTRWFVVVVFGVAYVLLPDTTDSWRERTLLTVSVGYMWLPVLISVARNFRSGWRGETTEPAP